MLSRRWIMMGIVGFFLTGWLVFVFAAPREPVIGVYWMLGISKDNQFVFRSDGSFVHLAGERQLAAGRWEFRGEKDIPVQDYRQLEGIRRLVTSREYTLLTETFEPGQHTPSSIFLLDQEPPGCLLIDGLTYYRAAGWFQQMKLRFLNWIR